MVDKCRMRQHTVPLPCTLFDPRICIGHHLPRQQLVVLPVARLPQVAAETDKTLSAAVIDSQGLRLAHAPPCACSYWAPRAKCEHRNVGLLFSRKRRRGNVKWAASLGSH